MIPRPSHPRRRKIRLGMKIRKNIDRTNKITRMVNRCKNGSEDIYEDENFKTLEAIRRIVEAKMREDESRRRVKLR